MAGLTSTGFVRKTEETLFDELVTEGRAKISPALDDSPDTVFGQLTGIHATKLAELWEALEAVYNAFSVNASGDALRRVAAITGTTPQLPTKSKVVATVTVSGAGYWTAGSIIATVDGNSSARFVSAAYASAEEGGVLEVLMEADTTGPVAAPAGTLTVLENPPTGVTAITNAGAAEAGRDAERDAELRLRRLQELQRSGAGTVDAIRSAVRAVDGVSVCRVYSNRTYSTDAEGRSPKCFEAVVLGGADGDIAQAIWDNMPAGIEAYGASGDSGTARDSEGYLQSVAFTRAAARRLYCRITGTKTAADYAGDATLSNAVSQFTAGKLTLATSGGATVSDGAPDLGGTIRRSAIVAICMTVAGVDYVGTVEFSEDGATWTNADYQLGVREYLGLNSTTLGIQAADVTIVLT